jgi:hypothetical protein
MLNILMQTLCCDAPSDFLSISFSNIYLIHDIYLASKQHSCVIIVARHLENKLKGAEHRNILLYTNVQNKKPDRRSRPIFE